MNVCGTDDRRNNTVQWRSPERLEKTIRYLLQVEEIREWIIQKKGKLGKGKREISTINLRRDGLGRLALQMAFQWQEVSYRRGKPDGSCLFRGAEESVTSIWNKKGFQRQTNFLSRYFFFYSHHCLSLSFGRPDMKEHESYPPWLFVERLRSLSCIQSSTQTVSPDFCYKRIKV